MDITDQGSTFYPDADLPGELLRIEYWFQKNPDRRKTKHGMHSFVKVLLDRKMRDCAFRQYSTKRCRCQNAFNDLAFGRNMISRS